MAQEMLKSESGEGIEWELNMLKNLQGYIDDLPEKQLMPGDPNYDRYKCRTAWWSSVKGTLELLEARIPPEQTEVLAQIKELRDYISSIDFTYGKPRTKEEIDSATERLDTLVNLLSRE
jgi:hypothetical protein